MDQLMVLQKESYLNVGFEVAKRLAHTGYTMEAPAFFITWGQIAEELSHILVDQGIQPGLVTDEELCDLIVGMKNSLSNEFVLHWREFARTLALKSMLPVISSLAGLRTFPISADHNGQGYCCKHHQRKSWCR